MKESWKEQWYLTEYRMSSTRQIFLCISHARPPKRGLKILAGSNIGGTTWNQDKINNYTLLSIKCPLPDKLSAANILPDTPKVGHADILVKLGRNTY